MALEPLIACMVIVALTTGGLMMLQKVIPLPGRAGRPSGRRTLPLHGSSTAIRPTRGRRNRAPSVSAVIPTLNEAGCLAWVLENLPVSVNEVVLVDGLSTDETEVIARASFRDIVVVHQTTRGKGAALRAGFAAASGDIIVMLDADGSTSPDEIDSFIAALQDGAEFVKGSRHMAGGGSDDLTLVRSAGNLFFTGLVNLLYGRRFTDLCYGYCAFWRHALERLDLAADGFEIETELALSAVKANLDIREVPSHERLRRAGTSNLNAWRDGRRVLRTIFAERPGRERPRPATEFALLPVTVAMPGTDKWVPAGAERRRADRRSTNAARKPSDRRRNDRRTPPTETVVVYRAVPATEVVEGVELIAA